MLFGLCELQANPCDRFANPQDRSAHSCKNCHAQEFRDWSKSRHSVAHSNEIFLRGYHYEPHERCLNCHAPSAHRGSQEASSEGVTCITCHESQNPSSGDIELASRQCARCHQFQFLKPEGFAQRTFDEWKEYAKMAGAEARSCQGCHMPKGSHVFIGPHSAKKKKTSLEIWIRNQQSKTTLHLKNAKAGHDVPTGDVFRHLTIEVKLEKQKRYQLLGRIGRNPFLVLTKTDQGQSVSLNFKNNNAIRPREERVIVLPNNSRSVRVVYFFEAPWAGAIYRDPEGLAKKIIWEEAVIK